MPSWSTNLDVETRPLQARDIMATRLVTVRPRTDIAQAIHLLLNHGISGMPVVDDQGNYLGMFSEKCCMEVLTRTAQLAGVPWQTPPRARDFMVTQLFSLRPEQDAIAAVGELLRRQISGAPVIDGDRTFLGVFSEKTAMNLLIEAAYEQCPSAEVSRFMNPDQGRFVSEETDLLSVARIFLETPYRRLEVVRGHKVLGQISRRDVLRSSRILETILRYQIEPVEQEPGPDSQIILRAHDRLPSTNVFGFMDNRAETISEETDLLTIAQLFLNTPYRRLPVVRGRRVVGQVSRRDLLRAVYRLLEPEEVFESATLYLSATRERWEIPVL